MKPVHDFDPDGRRARDPAHIPHRLAGEIPGPDADGVIARVPDAPVIAHVLARPGFHGGPEARRQRALHAEGPASALSIGQNVGDDVGRRLGEHPARRAGRGFIGSQAERSPDASIGERTISVYQVPKRHVRRAQRQRGAVEIRRTQIAQSEQPQPFHEGIDSHQEENLDRGDVERRRERRAGGDRTLELIVVVLRPIHAALNRNIEWAVFDQARAGQNTGFQRKRIQKRLQCRPRLAPRLDAIHEARARRLASVSDIGQDVARSVLHCENGAVANILGADREQVALKRVRGEPLEPRIQRRSDANRIGPALRAAVLKQPAGNVRRQRGLRPYAIGTAQGAVCDPRDLRGIKMQVHRIRQLRRAPDHLAFGRVRRPDERGQ